MWKTTDGWALASAWQSRSRSRASAIKDVVYSTNLNRAMAFRLPHGETGTGLAAHAVYHELADDIWMERRQSPAVTPEAEVEVPPPRRRSKKVLAAD